MTEIHDLQLLALSVMACFGFPLGLYIGRDMIQKLRRGEQEHHKAVLEELNYRNERLREKCEDLEAWNAT